MYATAVSGYEKKRKEVITTFKARKEKTTFRTTEGKHTSLLHKEKGKTSSRQEEAGNLLSENQTVTKRVSQAIGNGIGGNMKVSGIIRYMLSSNGSEEEEKKQRTYPALMEGAAPFSKNVTVGIIGREF
jgi:hypothetical protein